MLTLWTGPAGRVPHALASIDEAATSAAAQIRLWQLDLLTCGLFIVPSLLQRIRAG
jgi:hypothetical protein